MIIIRLLALAFWVMAALSLGGDIWTWAQSGEFEPLSLGKRWFDVSSDTLTLAQSAVQRYISPALWEDVIQPFLGWPAWVGLALIAALLSLLSRRRRRRIID